jgi:pimeloyl-ACP methyl ester carboxylesterase
MEKTIYFYVRSNENSTGSLSSNSLKKTIGRKSIWGLLLACLLFTFPLSAQEEEVILQTLTGNIHGALMCPKLEAPVPVVLIIAGSGPTDRNGNQIMMTNNSLKFLSEALLWNGIASLRFDKRGIAQSDIAGGKEEDLRFEDYVNDVRLWIDRLDDDIRFSKVVVAGHSEGSLIGMLASKDNPKVKSFISIAGSALPADEILKEQMEKQPQQVKDLVFPRLEQLKRGELFSDVPQMLYALFRPSVQPYMISWFKYNPYEEIKKLTIPVLILQGKTDIQVSAKHANLLSVANPEAKMVIIENMNHVLKNCQSLDQASQMETYTNPELPVKKDLVLAITQFINDK